MMNRHEELVKLAEQSKNMPQDQQPTFVMMEFRDFQRPSPPHMPGPNSSPNK